MVSHRVVGTERDPESDAPHDPHIVAIVTRNGYGLRRRWRLAEVYRALEAKEGFFTVSPTSFKTATIGKFSCRACGRQTLHSSAEAVHDNRLDTLPSV